MLRDDDSLRRRDVLKVAGAGTVGIAGLAGCSGGSGDGGGESGSDDASTGSDTEEYPPLGNFPIDGDTATFGFNVPQSGPYASEGQDELRAYELAVKHLNNGGGWVDSQFDDLSGDGVLDFTIDYVDGDTATDADTARQSASRMIQRDGAMMVSGGSSSAAAIAVQGLCQNENVMFMACLAHSNDTTGKDCVRYGFKEQFNAYMTGQALAPVVRDEYGTDLDFYQLYADYSWGQTQQSSMERFMTDVAGWSQIDSVATPLGTTDFSNYLSGAASENPDVLILNHYGLDGANSIQQAVDAGLDEDMEIMIPLYNRPMAQAAGGAIEDVFGTVVWTAQIDNAPSNEFTRTFQNEYDRIPSGAAQLAYAQTLQYAAAVERAGTFYPVEVIKQLEGYEYNNIGMGKELMRACDHQAQRDVPVVRGLPESDQSEGTYYEVVTVTSRDDVGYACDAGPSAECDLGSYE
ncbi:substrate-binding protein [Haloquadratum walsbyi]|jgi:amino acid/amide ABC transporter substrate-binding protein, HAAT family (TC 3.A.1.4.-)|uniref:ABC-type branched-chain amino acid transport system, periplasmic component n=1 Tax=Haloquadratum walsbyi J07HQW2 TaxID=1238425 RepID=U1PS68_9EURY|nr:MAG: ABC-type branched-chain amino acid transport system, periplasmic component [Haloquadratum walsbyi J07HQW2]